MIILNSNIIIYYNEICILRIHRVNISSFQLIRSYEIYRVSLFSRHYQLIVIPGP